MVKNVGTIDRVARVLAACFLFFLAVAPGVVFSANSSVDRWITILFYVAGGYLLISAILGTCLIYRMLDVDSHVHGGTYYSGEDPYDGRGGN
jgi:ABC-type multidrug transport system permease subunit